LQLNIPQKTQLAYFKKTLQINAPPLYNAMLAERIANSLKDLGTVSLAQKKGRSIMYYIKNNFAALPHRNMPVKPINIPVIAAETQPQKPPAVKLSKADTATLPADFSQRKQNVIRTLFVNTDSILLRVYDNGVVDGDVVSVIYNDKVVIDKLSLTTKSFCGKK